MDGARSSVWEKVVGKLRFDELSSDQIKEQYSSALKQLLEDEADPSKRLNYRFRLLSCGEEPHLNELIEDVLNEGSDDHWLGHRRLKRLSEIDSSAVSEMVITYILEGKRTPFRASEFITEMTDEQAEVLI